MIRLMSLMALSAAFLATPASAVVYCKTVGGPRAVWRGRPLRRRRVLAPQAWALHPALALERQGSGSVTPASTSPALLEMWVRRG